MKLIKTFGKVALGIALVLIASAVLGYILTIGEYYVPQTIEQDPSLPNMKVNGVTLHGETYGDPSNPVVITITVAPAVITGVS